MSPEDKLDMLMWLSARNAHVPVSDLLFLLGLPAMARDEDEECEARLPVQH
jgi:hypothetical protein